MPNLSTSRARFGPERRSSESPPGETKAEYSNRHLNGLRAQKKRSENWVFEATEVEVGICNERQRFQRGYIY